MSPICAPRVGDGEGSPGPGEPNLSCCRRLAAAHARRFGWCARAPLLVHSRPSTTSAAFRAAIKQPDLARVATALAFNAGVRRVIWKCRTRLKRRTRAIAAMGTRPPRRACAAAAAGGIAPPAPCRAAAQQTADRSWQTAQPQLFLPPVADPQRVARPRLGAPDPRRAHVGGAARKTAPSGVFVLTRCLESPSALIVVKTC